MEKIGTQITNLSFDEIEPIVSKIVAQEISSVGKISTKEIGRSGGHATAGIYHVSGDAETSVGRVEWSAVIKALGVSENPSPNVDDEALKETKIYRSRAFTDIRHGVRAAHCYGIQNSDELTFLWLEDLSNAPQPPWESSHFISVANHFGRFNTSWSEADFTKWTWLSEQSFQARFQSPHFNQAFDNLMSQPEHPLVQAFLPPSTTTAFAQMWDSLDQLLALTADAPTGICHCDCHPKNLFPMGDPQNGDYTVGIDWTQVGVGPLGLDIGHLLASPLSWMELTVDEARQLIDPIYNSYIEGVADHDKADVGNKVQLVYLTRIACEAKRNTALISHSINNPQWLARMEELGERPIEQICTRFCQARELYYECTERALELVK